MASEKVNSITAELKGLGLKGIGKIAPEKKYLASLMLENEKIGGIVYGAYSGGLAWLIATNLRILFIDRKPLFSSTDEISYDVVSGIKSVHAGMVTSIILHTRMGDYTIKFVNAKSAQTFIKFIENMRIRNSAGLTAIAPQQKPAKDDSQAIKFLKAHEVAVLSTMDREGNIHGAAVYYALDNEDNLYVLTKSSTGKARNILAHSQVAMTVFEESTMRTVQLQGTAEVETDEGINEKVLKQIDKIRVYAVGKELPPIERIQEGQFLVIKITPSFMSYHDYA